MCPKNLRIIFSIRYSLKKKKKKLTSSRIYNISRVHELRSNASFFSKILKYSLLIIRLVSKKFLMMKDIFFLKYSFPNLAWKKARHCLRDALNFGEIRSR